MAYGSTIILPETDNAENMHDHHWLPFHNSVSANACRIYSNLINTTVATALDDDVRQNDQERPKCKSKREMQLKPKKRRFSMPNYVLAPQQATVVVATPISLEQ
jgi:hypothetical protein